MHWLVMASKWCDMDFVHVRHVAVAFTGHGEALHFPGTADSE